jgi:thiol-disulfide isomerase/thioredoxin
MVLLVALAVNAWQSRHVPAGSAPGLDAPLLAWPEAGDASLQTWLARHRGEVVAVHFWATWCPICKASEDNITRLMGDWPIVTVAMQSGDELSVQRHLQKARLPWPTALDPQGTLAKAWGVSAVPATVILDRQGRIAMASMGYTSTLGLRGRLWWVRVFGA